MERIFAGERAEPRPAVTLTDFDPEAEDKLLAAICYPQTHLPEDQVLAKVRTLGDRRPRRVAARRTWGSGRNRRHKPGRAFERVDYRFDVVADYGAFRDLQRHRMLTIEWQPLSTASRLRDPRGGRGSRAARSVRRRDGTFGRARTTRCSTRSPSRRRTRCRSRTASASRCRSTRARRCTCSSCAPRRRATRRTVRSARRCTGSSRSRPVTAPSPRRCRYVDHTTYELERLAAERAAEARRTARRVTTRTRAVARPIRECDRSLSGRRTAGKIHRPLTSVDARRCWSRRHARDGSRLTRTPSVGPTTRRPHRSVVGHPARGWRHRERDGHGGSGDQVENAAITRAARQSGPDSGPNGLLGPHLFASAPRCPSVPYTQGIAAASVAFGSRLDARCGVIFRAPRPHAIDPGRRSEP